MPKPIDFAEITKQADNEPFELPSKDSIDEWLTTQSEEQVAMAELFAEYGSVEKALLALFTKVATLEEKVNG